MQWCLPFSNSIPAIICKFSFMLKFVMILFRLNYLIKLRLYCESSTMYSRNSGSSLTQNANVIVLASPVSIQQTKHTKSADL